MAEEKVVGLLFHGPEVVDEGEAEEALAAVRSAGFEYEAVLGGITGKTAIIDAGLQHIIDISGDKKPSEVALDFIERGIDFIILVNHSKNKESAIALGRGILRNVFKGLKDKRKFSFVQAEYAVRTFFKWILSSKHEEAFRKLKDAFGFDDEDYSSAVADVAAFAERADVRGVVRREISGVLPNEKILVNGVVIGRVSAGNKSGKITLIAKNGRIVGVEGGTLIEHNLVKLPPLDLNAAVVKTGTHIRRTKPRRVGVESVSVKGEKKKVCLFYTVENLYPRLEKGDVAIVITVGDDTTSIAGDILKRFEGIRLIGITDGDADGLIKGIETGSIAEYSSFLPRKSVIIRLKPERDDVVAEKVKREVLGGREEVAIEDIERDFERLKRRILDLAREDVQSVLSSE
ncbi:MAG: DUF2117 domain-containing protein [Candidatus Methanospirare jalkutatii]|nr:DUF2117 domain-containing protein [Candidatus Methanospirare jalkutatii]